MSDFDRDMATAPFGPSHGRAGAVAVDQGLRAYLLHIYNYMMLGLAVTGLAALAIYLASVTGDTANAAHEVRNGVDVYARISGGLYLTPFGQLIFASSFKWAVILAPLVLVLVLRFGIGHLRPVTAQAMFWIFAALLGVSFGSIFLVFAHASIVRVFFITAASFGALSLWGYTTPRDLTAWGSFLFMGLFGVILAGVVNSFLQAQALQWVSSVIGVVVFAGFTAYDTQRLKNEYIYAAMDGETAERSSILGALSLYLNFINLFALLLHLLGQRDE